MERKTIGKLISALRKANGMTQREFGEKLFVSDKTVSRWECDECTPDLSLIPAIAEIFGITADELLRGERNNPERSVGEARERNGKMKSEKQFRLMLEYNRKKYLNLTMISIGITILGLIAAMIANLSFSKGLIAFFLALAFSVASELCQICFALNARLSTDEEDELRRDQIRLSNNKVMKKAVEIFFLNLSAVAFCFPLVALTDSPNYGLKFGSWLLSGCLFAFAVVSVASVLYVLKVHACFCNRGFFVLTETDAEMFARNRKLLLKTDAIALGVVFILGLGLLILNSIGPMGLAQKKIFYNCDDFKAFMENQYDTWYGYAYPGNFGSTLKKEYGKIVNSDGEIICEYYFHNSLNRSIRFTESSEDKMPVTVVTQQAYNRALNGFEYLHLLAYGLMLLDMIGAVTFCLRKLKRA